MWWFRHRVQSSFRLSLCAAACVALPTFVGRAGIGNADGLSLSAPVISVAAADQEVRHLSAQAAGGESAEELAKKLSNPVASLISVPFQSNFDFNTGAGNDGWRYTLNVQPVIPIELNKDWNLITRTIVPFIYQDDVVDDGGSSQIGIGDVNQTFFLSPTRSDPIWGFGPVFLWPTASNDSLGGEKWAAGPAFLVLKQDGPLTYGVLTNHLWSYAGDDDRRSVNSTFIQPFLAYNAKSGFGVTLQAESTYDWNDSQWTIPVGLFASQVFKVGGRALSVSAGPRYWVEGPDGAPEWGFRFNLTFLFPQ